MPDLFFRLDAGAIKPGSNVRSKRNAEALRHPKSRIPLLISKAPLLAKDARNGAPSGLKSDLFFLALTRR